jgi:predicted cupin superfamily sugar epimerase
MQYFFEKNLCRVGEWFYVWHYFQMAQHRHRRNLVGCTVAPGFMFERFEMAGDEAWFVDG